jgi:signal transduction histidine kinase
MKYRTILILLIGFGSLLALIGILGFGGLRRAERIYHEVAAIHEAHRETALMLEDIQSDNYLSGILVRDYLLDPTPGTGPQYRKELLELRSALSKHLTALSRSLSHDEGRVLERLRREMDIYWESLDPVFEWTPQEKAARGSAFLRRQVIPRRYAIVSITREIDDLNAKNLRREEERIRLNRVELRAYFLKLFAFSAMVAAAVAGMSIFRVLRLEQRSEEQRRRAERAERELRYLSQKLVQAQEEERKSISRELHDEIGQLLTALKMELGNLSQLRESSGNEFQEHLAEAKAVTERTMRAVRDLAMGLRPSMLDDLGLGPALQWQVREFSSRSSIPVSLEIDGDPGGIPESVSTCIYRVTQEALTNCARHAQAQNVRITVHGSTDRIFLTVTDDGVGFDFSDSVGAGLGLIGMEERVKKLGGTLSISSRAQRGTVLEVQLPLKEPEAEP